jgi:hypothetical protein
MRYTPFDEDPRHSLATSPSRTFGKPSGRLHHRALPQAGVAERLAIGMIARHGADAAREAIVRLNRMIDRGDVAARDLWACVVHVIHERR